MQKLHIAVTMCQLIHARTLCEMLNWVTHTPGELLVCPESFQEEILPRRSQEKHCIACCPRIQGLPTCTVFCSLWVCTGSSRAHNILKIHLSINFQVNSREAFSKEAWEGFLQLRSQVSASADGSLEALITGTLSELLLLQLKDLGKFPRFLWSTEDLGGSIAQQQSCKPWSELQQKVSDSTSFPKKHWRKF